MADISNEIHDFQEAEYGEEVRDSMISLAEKVNKESTDAKTAAQKALADTVDATQKANTAATTANTAATNANTAKDAANTAAANANTKAQLADSKATLANTAASNADAKAQACQTATTAANTAATNANNKASAAQTATTAANTATTNANTARDAANTAATNANNKASAANTAATSANDAAAKALAAAAGDISNKTVTYTESTENTPPVSGSKLSLIAGWTVGKIRNILSKLTVIEQSTYSLTKINAIVNGEDLNAVKFTVPGIWTCDSASISASLKNVPYTTAGFKLIVEYIGATLMLCQTIVCQNEKTYMFKRRAFKQNGQWSYENWVCNDTDIENLKTATNQLNSDLGKFKVYPIQKWGNTSPTWTVTPPYGPFVLLTNSAIYMGFKYTSTVNFFEIMKKSAGYTAQANSDGSITFTYTGTDGFAGALLCINVN